MKGWYPRYLRVAGVGGLIFALLWLTLVLRQFSK